MIPLQKINRLLKENKNHCCQSKDFGEACVKIMALAALPTRFGNFQIVSFLTKDKREHVAVVKGDVTYKSHVLVRLHSECLTGDGFGSLRCDCRDQLTAALRKIEKQKLGIVLYLRQEGRGIGLVNKIKSYTLQDRGFDTIEADQMLGFSGDERDYNIAAHMLFSLKVKSIKLMTNNPKKISALKTYGIKVTDRIPLVMAANQYNRFYLQTKKKKAGHLLEE